MAESNATWGELAEHSDEMAMAWDSYRPLPEPGENPYYDDFIERKGLSTSALVRVGARMYNDRWIVFGGPGYIKFREVTTGERDELKGSKHDHLKIVPHGAAPTDDVIVAEGETDGAFLAEHYDCDVALLPGGAGTFRPSYFERLGQYQRVLVGLDTDAAGERGAKRILDALPNAVRFAPPANDWCSSTLSELPAIPPPAAPVPTLVSAGALLELEPPAIHSFFERALLPVGGQLIIHGWAKSFKSFLAIDMCAALAQCQPWALFEPTEEPIRVCVMQFEIPFGYYQDRVRVLIHHAQEPELVRTNLLTVTPQTRPNFRAGNIAQEDAMLHELENAGVSVFCLDPVRRATGAVDLNSEKEVRPILQFFERVQSLGISVIATHHDNKQYSRAGGGDPLGMTGAGAFAGDADTIVSVSLPRGQSADSAARNLHFTTRNAPSIGPRSFEMLEDGSLRYDGEPIHGANDDGSGQPTI